MSNELATTGGNRLALAADQEWWSEKQIAALAQIGVDRASNGDLAVFMHVCQRTGLDPFSRQIYMIERQGKQTIQTGIDGLRLVARRAVDRTGEGLSIGSAEWCGPDGQWTDVWLSEGPPAAARVTVRRGMGEFPAVALWREYAQTRRDGQLTQMWATRSAGQLAKCAEALALRKAFPQDLAGVYSGDEMGQGDRAPAAARTSGIAAALQTSGVPGVAAPAESDADPSTAEQASTPEGITSGQQKKLGALMREAGITTRDAALAYVNDVLPEGREVTSRSDLTKVEAGVVIDALEGDMRPVDGEVVAAEET